LKTLDFHNDWHVGDQLAQLHFLRKLCAAYPDLSFRQFMPDCYLWQMLEVVEDTDRITLHPNNQRPNDSVDSWINYNDFCGRHKNYHYQYVEFYLEFYEHLAGRVGLESPIKTVADMLYDYPAIRKSTPLSQPIGVLVINSAPLSEQFKDYNTGHFAALIQDLVAKGHKVAYTQKCPAPAEAICTTDAGLTVTGVGNLSLDCDYIISVGCGPMWPTINVWNQARVKSRWHLSTYSTLNYGPAYHDVMTISHLRSDLTKAGVL